MQSAIWSKALAAPQKPEFENHGAINRLTARFSDPELECIFLATRNETNLQQIRMAAFLAIALGLVFALLDYLVIRENLALALTIRLLWSVFGSALLYGLTFTPFFKSRYDLLGWLAIISATINYAALNAVSDTPEAYLSGFIIILLFLQFLFPLGFPETLAIGTSCTVAFAIFIPFARDLPSGQLLTIYSQFAATLVAGSSAVYLINLFRRREFLSSRKIEEQNLQYLDLLERILPTMIVTRMQAGETQIADDVPNAAVLFADVVGFTEIALRYSPDKVIESLNNLYERFDELVAKQSLEKIKTIGDAYMVAGGVPERQIGYVKSLADLALDMVNAAADCKGPDGAPMRIRVGINSGPLVAGVVGKSRFGYDLWGNTVNVASRMQTTARPGSIQVTEAVYCELAKDYLLDPLGAINVKGIGKIATWRLRGYASGPRRHS
jgi:class 3 adenylate cyclase